MIRFQCPTCKKVLKAADHGEGRKVNCPKCGQRLLIPPPVQAPPQNKTVLGESLPVPDWLGEVPDAAGPATTSSQTAPSHVQFDCPTCNVPLMVAQQQIGRLVQCPKCRTQFAARKGDTVSSVAQSGVASSDIVNPAHQHDTEPGELVDKIRIRRNNGGGSLLFGILLTLGGAFLAGVGFLMLIHYWDYDTSVPVYHDDFGVMPTGRRVHNVGLMQNRLIGVIISGGMFIVGLALYLIGLFVSPSRARKWLILGTVLPPILIVFLLLALGVFLFFAYSPSSSPGKRISLDLAPAQKSPSLFAPIFLPFFN